MKRTGRRHLRFVASYFESLQGLRVVPFGAYLVFSRIIKILGWPVPCEVLAFTLCSLASWRAAKYYERRFGHVETRSETRRLILSGGLAVLCMGARFVFQWNWADYFCAAWFLIGFWGAFERRWYYLPPALLFFTLAGMSGQLYRGEHNWLFGVSLLLTGTLDHLLLVHSLPDLQQSDGHA
jgi:hypothetical protein